MSDKQYLAIDDQDESVVKKSEYSEWRSLLFLAQFTKGQRGVLSLALVLLLIYSIFAMFSGHAIGRLVGDGLGKRDWDLAKKWAAITLFCEVLTIAFHYYGRKLLTNSASFVILNIREELFYKLNSLPMSFFDRWPQGRVVTRLTHDVEGVETFFTSSLGRMLNAFFLIIASITAMLSTHLNLGLILVASMIPSLGIVLLTRPKVNRLNRSMSKFSSQINSKLSEFIDGLYVIRSYGLETWAKDEFDNSVDAHLDVTLETNQFYSWSRPLVSFLCGLPVILLIWFGGNMVLTSAMSLAVFVAFIRYAERFFGPVMMLFREIHVILQAFTSARRVANFLRVEDEKQVLMPKDPYAGHDIQGEIEFCSVWMGYDNKSYSLKDVSFKVALGEKIGIVGPTGSGKTTTISILSRLYDFEKGDVLIDGQSIKSWDIDNLRSQIGLVSQDVIIFKGSLRDNLTVDPQVSDEMILNIAQVTGLTKLMHRNALTLNSKLKDGGANMSAGEKQVVSLTRTCLLDPRILILDEATAHVDPFYEKILHDGVTKVMNNRTSFIIAHRLDTIKECDRLLVFEDGKLVEIGDPEELIQRGGVFSSLAKAQKL